MSGSYDEVAWGIVTTFLAFVLGLVWQRFAQLLVNHRARHFWRPLVGDHLSVVLGRFRLGDFEPSGVVGAGDNIALKELTDHLNEIGFKRFSVSYHDDPGRTAESGVASLRGNLILLGGPDANSVTREVLGRTALGLHFTEVSAARLRSIQAGRTTIDVPIAPVARRRLGGRRASSRTAEWLVPVVVDTRSRAVYGPRADGEALRADCGIMIRCPNPFDPRGQVVIFCGSYGFGTWAAVRFAISDEFLRRLPRKHRTLECVLGVDIFQDAPQHISVEVFRPLPPPDAPGPRPVVTVPRMGPST